MSNVSRASALESISGVRRWVIWFVILAIISITVAMAFFISRASSDATSVINYVMYAVIGGLGVGLIIRSYFDSAMLDRETALASSQIRMLEQVDNFDDFLSKTRSSIFRAHIENLYLISQSHTQISQDNLIEILHSKMMARNKIVELFSSILITLGLIGTILGLILMMESLTTIMSTVEIDENFMKNLVVDGGPLSGLSVAFVTTLIGAILGGVILRVLTNVVNSHIMEYLAHISELTEVYVLPHLRQLSESNLNVVES